MSVDILKIVSKTGSAKDTTATTVTAEITAMTTATGVPSVRNSPAMSIIISTVRTFATST